MIKNYRQTVIKKIIEADYIETQDELIFELKKRGIKATQATVSRDVKEMMLLKLPLGDGHSHYVFPQDERLLYSEGRAARLMQDSLLSIKSSENIIVIKTVAGAASGIAALLDNVRWSEILGTVSGYDTVMVVADTRGNVPGLIKKIESLAYRNDEFEGDDEC